MKATDVLEDLTKTEIGNVVDITPAPFPNYGDEKLILRVPSKSQQGTQKAEQRDQEAKWITLYLATYPIMIQGVWVTHEPLVGRLQFGAGGGEGEIEFDLQPPQIFAFDPATGGLNAISGKEQFRYGLTVVSFHASSFQIKARSDRNLRTLIGAVGAPSGLQSVSIIGDPPLPIKVKAWANYGVRASKTSVTKTLVFSNGGDSNHLVGEANLVTIAVPVGAFAFRIYRYDETGATSVSGTSPQYKVAQRTANQFGAATSSQVQIIPVNENPVIELMRGAGNISLVNQGPNPVVRGYAVFDINI